MVVLPLNPNRNKKIYFFVYCEIIDYVFFCVDKQTSYGEESKLIKKDRSNTHGLILRMIKIKI